MRSLRLPPLLLLLAIGTGASVVACAPKADEGLALEAKVAEADARATALAAVPGGTVKDFELEREGSALIYSYDISVAGKTGIDEVHIDAMTGKLLSNDHETPADEAAEASGDSATGS